MNGIEIPSASKRRAEQAEAAEGGEQADARDRRRQDERQLDERDRERAAAEAPLASRYAVGVPNSEDQRLRDQARLQADDERVLDDRVRELVDQVGRASVCTKIADDRQQQERRA